MVSLFIFFIIIFLLEIVILILNFSRMFIDIKKCNISYNKKFKIDDLEIVIDFYLFKTIKICRIIFYKNYLKIFFIKVKYKFFKKFKITKKIYGDFHKDIIKIFRNLKYIDFTSLRADINTLYLNLQVGTISQTITTFSIPIISTIMSFILNNIISNYNIKDYNYKIMPKYINKNVLDIKLETKLNIETIKLIIFLKNIKTKKIALLKKPLQYR